jgi:hypothetical protein
LVAAASFRHANPLGKSALTVLTERIDAALTAGTSEDVRMAFGAVEEAALSGEEKENAALNAKIVRLVAKILQINAAPDRAKAVDALRAAARRAAKEPMVAEGLRESFDEGSLTSGDVALDSDIKGSLIPSS